VISGGGGRHYWFSQIPGIDIGCSIGKIAPGIDVRGDKGYIIVPPSTTKGPYMFESSFEKTDIKEIPNWLITLLSQPFRQKCEQSGLIPQGMRHKALVKKAITLSDMDYSPTELIDHLIKYRDTKMEVGDHPVSNSESEDIVMWAIKKPEVFALTDLGNVDRFRFMYTDRILWCEQEQYWYIWNGKNWERDMVRQVYQFAHETVRKIPDEAQGLQEEERKKIISHGISSQANPRIKAIIEQAKPYMPVKPEQLDEDPWLFNVANGTIDLRTGKLLAHNPKNFQTMCVDVPYIPGSSSPSWLNFIQMVTCGRQDLADYLQTAVGYSLTGITDEQCLFFLLGSGSNGKSTFFEGIRKILGQYYRKTDIDIILDSKVQTSKQFIAQLYRVRFACSNETPTSCRVNEAAVKDLTGGDQINGRVLFNMPFTFTPTCKLWIYGNSTPRIAGHDDAIWRRIKLITFSKTFLPEEVIPQSILLSRFTDEAPGILSWAVEGCLKWQSEGLHEPAEVIEATTSYRKGEDLIEVFIEERCLIDCYSRVRKDILYQGFIEWYQKVDSKNAERPTQRWFTRQITKHGYLQKGANSDYFCGLVIKS
jgi:putative DNA primase/helicase